MDQNFRSKKIKKKKKKIIAERCFKTYKTSFIKKKIIIIC